MEQVCLCVFVLGTQVPRSVCFALPLALSLSLSISLTLRLCLFISVNNQYARLCTDETTTFAKVQRPWLSHSGLRYLEDQSKRVSSGDLAKVPCRSPKWEIFLL